MHTRFVIVALIGILNCSAKENKGLYQPAIDVEEMATNIFNNPEVPNCLVSSELNLGNRKTNPYLTLKKIYEPYTNLSIIELSCQDNNQEITLNKDQFEIYGDGKLLDKVKNKIYDKSHYCLQLLRDDDDEQTMFWEARVCVSIFRVPRCCFNNLGVNKLRNICDENEKHKFDPPIRYLNNSAIITFEEENIFNLECKNPDSVQSLEFRNGPIYLTYDQNEALNFVSGTVMSPKFCIGSNAKKDYFVQICGQTESLNQDNFNCSSDICIRKCCPQNQIYDYSQNSCAHVNGSHNWEPTFFNHESHANTTIPHNVSYMYGFPLCKKFFPLKPHENIDENFLVLDNGHLFVQKYKADYSSNFYCIDYFRKGGNTTEDSLLCFPEKEEGGGLTDCNTIHSKIYPILMIFSCVFLALTLIIYGILPDLYSKINGRCVMASTSALLLAYICFIIIIWSSATIPMTSCQLLGLFTQFFSLSSFFWLTVMCFDVWRALRSQRSVAGRPAQSVNKRFAKYSCFAWGCPLIISVVTAIMQFSKIKTSDGKPVVPGFGTSGCFFPSNDSRPSWAYFYGFISVLMAVNVGFFAHLLIMLFRERLQTDATLKRKNKRHLMWVKLYLKLFFVMGVTWIFEVISWVEGTCKLWIWTDSINALRGLLIFIIFVCKRDIMVKLRNRSILSSKRFNLSLMTSSSYENSKSNSVKQNSKFYVDIEIKETPS